MKPGSLVRYLSMMGAAILLMLQTASAADVHVLISAGFYGACWLTAFRSTRASRWVTSIPVGGRWIRLTSLTRAAPWPRECSRPSS